jgi:endonuclease/exonuclease/phosphatase family metal-dependent hydrolase
MRLLSYNIHKGIGGSDRLYRLERVIRVIEGLKPDLVCLQEVAHQTRRSRYHDQTAMLVKHFALDAHLFQLNVRWRVGGYGNLLLSRWPFHSKHHLTLTHGKRKARGAQLAVVATPDGPLHLVHWHLGLGERERRWQARHVLTHHLFRQSAHLPTVIVGDCNDWRNTLAHNAFAEHSFNHITSPPSHFRSFPAFMAMMALDKAFCRGGVTVRHAHVVRSKLARRASDHLPLVIDFHLENSHAHGLKHSGAK